MIILVNGPPPIAEDDMGVVETGNTLVLDLVANDSDLDGAVIPSTLRLMSLPQGGQVELLGGGNVHYTPDIAFSGIDTFTYVVDDNDGKSSNVAVVQILVAAGEPRGLPPVAQDDQATSDGNQISIGILGNDLDADGLLVPESVEVVQSPMNGAVESAEGGAILYAPNPGFAGVDRFSYSVKDDAGMVSNVAVVTIYVAEPNDPEGGGGGIEPETCDGRVIISEIAWAGTPSNPEHEWIELRNLGSTPVDLTGWTLQWRPAQHEPEVDEHLVGWVSIPLRGEIRSAAVPACATGQMEAASRIVVAKRDEDDVSWLVTGERLSRVDGFYLLERRTDETVANLLADLIYDLVEPFAMELPDDGAVMRLVNAEGTVVDTANDDPRYQGLWIAGDAATSASMERIDPLGADVAENWQTNLGVETYGEDAGGLDLWATAATLNSGLLEGYAEFLELAPTVVESRPGIEFEVAFAAADGLPWVRVLEGIDDLAEAEGAGGGEDERSYRVGYSFRLSFEGDSEKVAVDVGDLPPGRYDFWLALGDERMVYVPVEIVP